MEQVVKLSLDLDPMVSCGFVVADRNFNRVKVKSPAHRALDKLCWRYIRSPSLSFDDQLTPHTHDTHDTM
jgi:hypothetical protein